jgi:predicted methyltransferase
MTLHRRLFCVALSTTLLPACGSAPSVQRPAQSPAQGPGRQLQAAVDGAWRSSANRARDAARHPGPTLQFFGLQPDHVVVELAPGGGWYTEILAPYVRERGRLVAAHYATDDAQDYRRRSRAGFEAKLAASPTLYDRVALCTLPTGARFKDLPTPGPVDQVLTFRNLHNWLEDGTLDARLQAFHHALKPGGVFGVVDHRAAPGTPLDQQRRSGYLTEDLVIGRARAAGFVLAARSEVNANPRDTKDHPNGVWSLPPSLRGGDADRARFIAIGESDRFTHRYVKA